MLVACAAMVIFNWNHGYIDFGDGNYLYISWRLASGAVLYRDILAPQPPLHLMTGALLAKTGQAFGDPLYAFRAFSVILHLATALLVFLAGRNVWRNNSDPGATGPNAAGLVAAAIYLILPLGFWWSLGYQSEPLEIVLLLISFLLFLTWKRSALVAAGLFTGAAVLTNMTAAPFAVFSLVYLLIRKPGLVLWYVLPLLFLCGLTAAGFELWTGAYLENVFFNQVGSFPRKEFLPKGENVLTYAIGKIRREGGDVLSLEGGFIFLALIGSAILTRYATNAVREYAVWFSLVCMGSIIYVSKGGTEDYIFTLGEPYAAILAGCAVVFLARLAYPPMRADSPGRLGDISWFAASAALIALLAISMIPGLLHSKATLQQRTYELDEYRTNQVVELIRQNSKADQAILAPPFYAFLAQRKIAQDYSELFLWSIKYYNERQDKTEGAGVKTALKIADMLRHKEIAFVALDTAQTGKIPEIRAAIDANYRLLRNTEFRTLNTSLQFYVPKGR